jgi:hypothetical protein
MASPALEDALTAQGTELEHRVVDTRLRSGLERALATGADWIWVLDGTSLPRPGALTALFDGRERVGELPAPVLLTGLVVTPDGRVHPQREPWYHRFRIDLAVAAADHALVPVRGSRGPALVRRETVAATLPGTSAGLTPGGVLVWTARLLRTDTGYLVPESEYVAAPDGRDPMRDPRTAARLLAGGGLRRLDRIALLLELSERSDRG